MEKNEQSGRIENNPYSSAVFRRWLIPVRDMIEESVAATGKPGRRAAHVMLLRSLDPAAVAFIAVRSALTHTVSGGGDNARNLGNDIGKGVYGELVLATFEHINPELYWEVSHDLDRRRSKSSRHRYQTLRHSAQKAEIEVPYWTPAVPQYVMKDARNNPAITNITNDLGALEFNLSHGASGITRPEELNTVIDEYNSRHRKETGSEEPLINNTKRAQMLKEWMSGQLASDKQNLALAKKEDNFRLSGDLARQAFMTGHAASLKGLELDPKATNDAMNAEFDAAVGSNNPATIQRYFDRAAQVSHDEKLRSSKLQELMQVQVPALTSGNGPLTEQQITALNYVKGLYKTLNGPQAVADYVGADNAGKVIQLINSGVDTTDVQALNAQRQVIAHTQYKQASTADRTAMQDVINKADPGWFRRILPWGGKGALSGWELSPEVKKNLGDEYAHEAAQYARSYNLPMEQAAQIVLNKRLANADAVPGSIIQANDTVQGDVSLNSAVARVLRSKAAASQSTSIYQDAMKEMIHDRMTSIVKAKGADMANFKPDDWEIRSGAQLGDGRLMLFVWPKDNDAKVRMGGPASLIIGAGQDENDKNGLAWYINQHTSKAHESLSNPNRAIIEQSGLQKFKPAVPYPRP